MVKMVKMVSRSTCMGLGSHHSLLTTSKKLNRLKSQHCSWIHKTGGYTGQTSAPPRLERDECYRESQLPGVETEWKPLWEPVSGQENLSCNWWSAGGWVWTRLRVRTPGGPSHGRWAQYWESYLQELDQVLNVNVQGKSSPSASSRGRGKGTSLKYMKDCPQGKTS